jgi:hypothetical protein
MQKLKQREPEVLFSILALVMRFNEDGAFNDGQTRLVKDYVEAARQTITKRLMDGTVELSTIQSLCLLALIDFTGMALLRG